MNWKVERIRRLVGECARSRASAAYPALIRQAVTEYAREALSRGEGLDAVARAVGLCPGTVRRWWESTPAHERAGGVRSGSPLVPVRIVDDDGGPGRQPGPVLVTPGGYRIEGLGLAELTALLARLSR